MPIPESTINIEVGMAPEVINIEAEITTAGPTGPIGPPNTLAIGTVSSGPVASATITGTSPNQTLNLVTQKGDKGDKGDQGDTGPAGAGSGNVNGPAGAVNNTLALFNGTTGTLIKASTDLAISRAGSKHTLNATGSTSLELLADGGVSVEGVQIDAGLVAGRNVATDGTKLDGITALATKNDTDANLKNRANHTGTQAVSTITGLQTTLTDNGTAISNLQSDMTAAELAITGKQPLISISQNTVPLRTSAGGGPPDSSIAVSESATAATLVKRNALGTITTGVPTEDTHAGTKKYIDDKAFTPRSDSITSSSSITPLASTVDHYTVSALAAAMTINSPGTGASGQKLMLAIKDNGTTRNLTWNAIFKGIGLTLPAKTTAGKWLYIGAVYNAAASEWHVVAAVEQG